METTEGQTTETVAESNGSHLPESSVTSEKSYRNPLLIAL